VHWRNPVEFCDAGALQILGERRQLLDVLPDCFRRQSAMRLHKQQIRCQNRGKPGWGRSRRTNTSAKLSSFVCVEKDSDRGSKNTGAAGTRLRRASGYVLPYRVGVGGQQRQAALLEVPGEAQPFVKMLAYYFVRIAQFQQTTSNVIHALPVGRRAVLPALVTRKPV
jgi:hypothetical protein